MYPAQLCVPHVSGCINDCFFTFVTKNDYDVIANDNVAKVQWHE